MPTTISKDDIQVTIRISRTLKADLEKIIKHRNQTDYERTSFNGLCVKLLAEYARNNIGDVPPEEEAPPGD